MISYQVLHPVLHSPRRCAKPPFLGVSECKYGVRTPDRALTITVFTDIGAVGTVIFCALESLDLQGFHGFLICYGK